MKVEYHTWESPILGHGTELKSYGHRGRPMLVFPSSQGRFYDYENNGMINAISHYIETGELVVFTVDGIDWQSWFNTEASPADKAWRHEQYDRFVYQEVVPFISEYPGITWDQNLIVTGCSFGAYHSMNFFLRHPDVISTVIALSGVYSVNFSVGEYLDENVLRNDPIRHLSRMEDPSYLDYYRESQIILCVGRGAWEDWMIEQTRRLSDQLSRKGIDHWLDYWGHDVNHDWPWWRKQIIYFLDKINL